MNRLFITLLLLPLLAQVAPVDLSPPSNTLGSADRRGHLQFTVALQSADFGDGAKIPVHFTFNSGNQATSPYGWDNWTVGILEASVTDTKPGEKQVTLLCSKKLYFLEQQDGTWKSRDGAWTGESSGNDFTISRWDGWELKFTHGQVARLTTDGGKVIAWDRDGTPERRVTAVRDVASGQSVLEPIYDGNGHPTSLRINGDSYPLTREVGYPRLTQIGFPDTTSWQFSQTEHAAPGGGTELPETGVPGSGVGDAWVEMTATNRDQIVETFQYYLPTGILFSDRLYTYWIGGTQNPETNADLTRYRDENRPAQPVFASAYPNPGAPSESTKYSTGNAIVTRTKFNGLVRKTWKYQSNDILNGKAYKVEETWDGQTETTRQVDYDAETGDRIRTIRPGEGETNYSNEPFPGVSKYAPPERTTTTYADGSTVVREYDLHGNLLKTTDETGVSSSYEYDSRNRIIKIFNDAEELVAQMSYNDNDAVTSRKDAAGNETTYEYLNRYGQSLLTKVTTPTGLVTEYEYDARGNRTKVILPGGTEWSMTYTPQNRVEKVIAPDGTETEYQYDARANVIKLIDAAGRETDLAYNEFDLPEELTNALNHTAEFAYNLDGKATNVTDFRGKTYTLSYGRDGQQTGMTQPDAAQETWTYNDADELAQWQPRGGQGQSDLTYDPDRGWTDASSWTYAGNTGGSNILRDAAGRIVAMDTTLPLRKQGTGQ